MSNPTDTNQASEDELIYSVDLGIPGGDFITLSIKKGSTLFTFTGDEAVAIIDVIRTEKLKLLAEVRERVVGEDTQNPYSKSSDRFFNDWGHQASEYDKFIRGGMRDKLTKLEAELLEGVI